MIEFSLIFGAGIIAGALGGMLGIGGGVIIMPTLRFIIGLSPAFAAGTCIVAVFFTTLGGSHRHFKLGHIHLKSIVPFVITGAISTFIFSFIFLYFTSRQSWIDLGVGLVFAFVSIRMILEGLPGLLKSEVPKNGEGENEIVGSLWKKLTLGGAAGVLPGLLGIGTGAILVPAFTFLFGASVKVAMGSSLACFTFNAFWSSILKLSQGFVDIKIAIPLCLGTLLGSNIGAVLNRRFPSAVLKLTFGIVFCYVSLKFILMSFEMRI